MPKPIIKKDAVKFESANLEEFVIPPKTVIQSGNLQWVEEEIELHSPAKNRSVISNTDVLVQSQGIEIYLEDLSSSSFQQHAPEHQTSISSTNDQEDVEEHIDREKLAQLQQQLEDEWQKKLKEEVERAKAEAFEEGFNRAQEELGQKAENSKKEFAIGLDRFKESWENYLKRSEATLMQIALEITQFIIDIPLPKQYSDITERVLNDALDQLSRETPLTLSLNPLDLLRLQESGIMDVIKEKFSALRWDPQPTLKEGNWIIQTPKQAIRRISEELLHNLKDQFGLLEHGQTDIEVNSTLPGYEIEYIPPVTNVAVSTTPVPIGQNNTMPNPVPTTGVLNVEHDQIKNVVFSPATLTATSSSLSAPNLSEIPESDS